MTTKKNTPKNKILHDYKKVGSKFIPPMKHRLGEWHHTSYARQTLPQLIWWDILAQEESQQFVIEVATEIGKFSASLPDKAIWLAFASDFEKLSDNEVSDLIARLNACGFLSRIRSGLSDFLTMYPECPLRRLTGESRTNAINWAFVDHFENRLGALEDKRSVSGVLMQAQAIYIGFVGDKFGVAKGLALADFPEVGNYPNTERSNEVAASICATLIFCAGQFLPPYNLDTWSIYFWKRSLELRPLNFDHLEMQ